MQVCITEKYLQFAKGDFVLILYRIIGLLFACCFMLFSIAPVPTSIIMLVLFAAFLFFKFYLPHKTVANGRVARREAALKKAKIYLAPYEDIWRDLKLSNPHCYLTLGMDGMTIEGFEKTKGGAFRSFRVLKSNVHDWEELWNMFCKAFNYSKSYDGLLEDCRRFSLVIEEKLFEKPVEQKIPVAPAAPLNRVDINNCTEDDLTALPGISIIMAKKAVKRRNETGGFNSVEDFFAELNIQTHMQEQLRKIIYVGKKPEQETEKRSTERKVDF